MARAIGTSSYASTMSALCHAGSGQALTRSPRRRGREGRRDIETKRYFVWRGQVEMPPISSCPNVNLGGKWLDLLMPCCGERQIAPTGLGLTRLVLVPGAGTVSIPRPFLGRQLMDELAPFLGNLGLS